MWDVYEASWYSLSLNMCGGKLKWIWSICKNEVMWWIQDCVLQIQSCPIFSTQNVVCCIYYYFLIGSNVSSLIWNETKIKKLIFWIFNITLFIHIYMYIYVHIHMYRQLHMYIHTYIHMYTHTLSYQNVIIIWKPTDTDKVMKIVLFTYVWLVT